jgi:hypothetical protein
MFSMLTSSAEIRVLAIDLLSGKKKERYQWLRRESKDRAHMLFPHKIKFRLFTLDIKNL